MALATASGAQSTARVTARLIKQNGNSLGLSSLYRWLLDPLLALYALTCPQFKTQKCGGRVIVQRQQHTRRRSVFACFARRADRVTVRIDRRSILHRLGEATNGGALSIGRSGWNDVRAARAGTT